MLFNELYLFPVCSIASSIFSVSSIASFVTFLKASFGHKFHSELYLFLVCSIASIISFLYASFGHQLHSELYLSCMLHSKHHLFPVCVIRLLFSVFRLSKRASSTYLYLRVRSIVRAILLRILKARLLFSRPPVAKSMKNGFVTYPKFSHFDLRPMQAKP